MFLILQKKEYDKICNILSFIILHEPALDQGRAIVC